MIVLNKKIADEGNGKQALSQPEGSKLEVQVNAIEMQSNELQRSESNPNEKDIVEKLFFSLSGCPKDSARGASRKEESE